MAAPKSTTKHFARTFFNASLKEVVQEDHLLYLTLKHAGGETVCVFDTNEEEGKKALLAYPGAYCCIFVKIEYNTAQDHVTRIRALRQELARAELEYAAFKRDAAGVTHSEEDHTNGCTARCK